MAMFSIANCESLPEDSSLSGCIQVSQRIPPGGTAAPGGWKQRQGNAKSSCGESAAEEVPLAGAGAGYAGWSCEQCLLNPGWLMFIVDHTTKSTQHIEDNTPRGSSL